MASWFFAFGAIVALIAIAIHGYAGHRLYVKVVLASGLFDPHKALSYVAWHTVTIVFLTYGLALAWLAVHPGEMALAVLVLFANGMTAGLFVVLALAGHGILIRFPGLYISLLLSFCALAGMVLHNG